MARSRSLTPKECIEKLADFLLDELPEHEAILVQEAILLHPEVAQKYKELKGTGKSLEAVPEFKDIEGSEDFETRIREQAVVESQKLILNLPPEKRLRAQMRKERRGDRPRGSNVSQRAPSGPWSGAVIAILVTGVVLASLILLYPTKSGLNMPGQVGTLQLVVGRVEQFFTGRGQPWSAAVQGKTINSTDEFSTAEDGRARFQLQDGGFLFVGPNSECAFRPTKESSHALVAQLRKGEMGVTRPAGKTSAEGSAQAWILKTADAEVFVDPDTTVYLRFSEKEPRGVQVTVARGRVKVEYGEGREKAFLQTGEQNTFSSSSGDAPEAGAPEFLIPAWRVDLMTDVELRQYMAGKPTVIGHKENGPQIEFTYQGSDANGLRDWISDRSDRPVVIGPDNKLALPGDAKVTFATPLSAPVSLELTLVSSQLESRALAFAVLDDETGRVSVDVTRDALLQVRHQGRHRAARQALKKNAAENELIRVEVAPLGHQVLATITTGDGTSKPLDLPKDMSPTGKVWITALGGNVTLETLKISGVVPRTWLQQKLAGR